jgi:hypothetical protein
MTATRRRLRPRELSNSDYDIDNVITGDTSEYCEKLSKGQNNYYIVDRTRGATPLNGVFGKDNLLVHCAAPSWPSGSRRGAPPGRRSIGGLRPFAPMREPWGKWGRHQ